MNSESNDIALINVSPPCHIIIICTWIAPLKILCDTLKREYQVTTFFATWTKYVQTENL